jgi:V8-like Glu-specific endopeptidase
MQQRRSYVDGTTLWLLSCVVILTLTFIINPAVGIDATFSSSQSLSSTLRRVTTARRSVKGGRREEDVLPEVLDNNINEAEEISPRIAGGQNAVQGRYPYYVALRDKNDKFRCGGSLIAPNIVLTAAHCQYVYIFEARSVVL